MEEGLILHTESVELIRRAVIAQQIPGRVLLHDGDFCKVRYVVPDGAGKRAFIAYDIVGRARNFSIDDCSPAAWREAVKRAQQTR